MERVRASVRCATADKEAGHYASPAEAGHYVQPENQATWRNTGDGEPRFGKSPVSCEIGGGVDGTRADYLRGRRR